jgi:hypothetical protein
MNYESGQADSEGRERGAENLPPSHSPVGKETESLIRQLRVDPGVFLTKTSTIGFGDSHVWALSHDHVLREHVLLAVAEISSFLDLTNGSGGSGYSSVPMRRRTQVSEAALSASHLVNRRNLKQLCHHTHSEPKFRSQRSKRSLFHQPLLPRFQRLSLFHQP